jgi:hypothetical protein
MVRSRQPAEQEVLGALQRALTNVARPNPLTVAWRWRYEITAASMSVITGAALIARSGPWWTLTITAGTIIAIAATPPARRWVAARVRVVVVQHRVRVGCKHAWIHSRDGKLPAILWTSARSYGERVILWCPPGVTGDDLIDASQLLAVACWATEVVVEPDPTRAYRVVLHVVRGGKVGP